MTDSKLFPTRFPHGDIIHKDGSALSFLQEDKGRMDQFRLTYPQTEGFLDFSGYAQPTHRVTVVLKLGKETAPSVVAVSRALERMTGNKAENGVVKPSDQCNVGLVILDKEQLAVLCTPASETGTVDPMEYVLGVQGVLMEMASEQLVGEHSNYPDATVLQG